MPTVKFQGQRFQFPEGATDEQIETGLRSYMEQAPIAGASTKPDTSNAERVDAPLAPTRESYFNEGDPIPSMTALTEQQALFAKHIATIETGGLPSRAIRTKVRPSDTGQGSSAYGKYQITHGLLSRAISTGYVTLDVMEQRAAEDLMERQRVALSVGGRDRAAYQQGGAKHELAVQWAAAYGYADVDKFLNDFNYGGSLGLEGNGEFLVLYESFARKLLNKHLEDANGDMVAAAAVWHGGPKGAGKATQLYKQKMRRLLEADNAN